MKNKKQQSTTRDQPPTWRTWVKVVRSGPPLPEGRFGAPELLAFWRKEIMPKHWFSGQQEILVLFVLSQGMELLGVELVTLGSGVSASSYPALVLQPVLACGGHYFILAHNHPISGPAEPSKG